MQSYLLEDVQALQQHLARSFAFYQVVKDPGQQCHWQQLDNLAKCALPALITEKPLSSAKGYFFAEHENVLEFDGEVFRQTIPAPAPFVLFGVLSCDLSAIYYQDLFFKSDPYYQARRRQALLVGLDCTSPCQYGFCHKVDAGPGVRSHTADLTLHPLNDNRYLLSENTDKGAKALAGLTSLTQATEQQLAQKQQNLQQCEQAFADTSHISRGIAKINDNSIPESLWQQMAIQCIGCSGCTSLCPTCSCYGIQEIKRENGDISQQRFWDSCLYEGFQREASFHNPSIDAGKRVQRFWQHKFSNAYLDEFQRYGCVGCGRCEQTCPGVIGVHSVMKRIVSHE